MQDPSGCGKAAGRKKEKMPCLLCRHVDGAFGQFRGDGQTVCRQRIGVDVQVGIADGLVGDILGAFAAQDARRHAAGLTTKFGILNTFGRDAAVDDLLDFAAEHGLAVFFGLLQHNGKVADDSVVGQVRGAVHLREQRVKRHREVSAGGNALVDDFKAVVRGKFLVKGEGRVAVGFARRVQDADLRCIGHQRADELQLGFHRQRVARAGDVAGVLAVGAGEHGADRVGHGSVDDRDARILPQR